MSNQDQPHPGGGGAYKRASRKGAPRRFSCTHPGCDKIYSRAEHLQRHQLNRETKALQAAALSGRSAPAGCQPLLDWLDGIIDPIEGDRPFGEDIERLIQADWTAGDLELLETSPVSARFRLAARLCSRRRRVRCHSWAGSRCPG